MQEHCLQGRLARLEQERDQLRDRINMLQRLCESHTSVGPCSQARALLTPICYPPWPRGSSHLKAAQAQALVTSPSETLDPEAFGLQLLKEPQVLALPASLYMLLSQWVAIASKAQRLATDADWLLGFQVSGQARSVLCCACMLGSCPGKQCIGQS